MTLIRMTPDTLREQSNTYGVSANQIDEILATLTRLQGEIGDAWDGTAWDKFDEQFNDLKPKVESFSELLNDIDKQLKEVARVVEETDAEIASKLGF